MASSIVCGCIRSISIEGRKGKGEGVVVGVLRVHGGEESLVLELVRMTSAAAVAVPAVAASHFRPPSATRASTRQADKARQALVSLSPRLPALRLWATGRKEGKGGRR